MNFFYLLLICINFRSQNIIASPLPGAGVWCHAPSDSEGGWRHANHPVMSCQPTALHTEITIYIFCIFFAIQNIFFCNYQNFFATSNIFYHPTLFCNTYYFLVSVCKSKSYFLLPKTTFAKLLDFFDFLPPCPPFDMIYTTNSCSLPY